MIAVVFTLGCKVNKCESDSLLTSLNNLGYETYDDLRYADLYILNTCAITAEAEKKSRQAIARMRKFNPQAKILVMGCASQKNYSQFLNKENVTVILGAKSKSKILELLDKKEVYIEKKDVYDEMDLPQVKSSRVNVKIQDGCNNFCHYCIVPYLRGRSRSRSVTSIVNEVKLLKADEIILTGINISAYDYNGQKLPELLGALSFTDKRIRLGSIEVNVIDEKLISSLKKLKDFAPHFHLSLQSGSNKVLKEMNRRYTTEEYYSKVQLIRENFDNAGITTDVICGYPTETEEDFNDCIEFLKRVGFSDVHCFPFSMRQGTYAERFLDLPSSVKKEREGRLIKVKEELKNAFIQKNLNENLFLIAEEKVDGFTVGYTENYLRVYVRGDFEGKKEVKIVEPYKDGAIGILV